MLKYIRDELVSMTDKGNYQTSTSSLIPGCNNIIGVRQPALKKYAKQLVKENEDFRKLLTEPDLYYEETLLRGYIIGMGTANEKDFDKALEDLKKFVPLIDNWAVNDGFCVEFRIMDKYRQEFLPFLEKCILSEDEFEARAGLIMLLDHYIKVDADGNKKPRMKKVMLEDIGMCGENNNKEEQGMYIDKILVLVNRDFSSNGYYTQMAAGWLLAECFVTFPLDTWRYLTDKENMKLDNVSYKKAIRKICESLTPDDEVKKVVRELA